MANDAPAESLSQKVERYFSFLILFITDSRWSVIMQTDGKLIFDLQITVPSFFSNVPTFLRVLGHCPQI